MNINNWIPKLSESVKGIDNALYDTDLDLTIPLNNIARIIIKEMDGKNTCGDIFEKTKDLFSIDNEIYFIDLKEFILMINSKGIINLRYKNYYPLIEEAINFIAQYHPKLRFRYEENKDAGFLRVFFLMFNIVMKQVFIFWFIPTIYLIVLFYLSQSNQFLFLFGNMTMAFSGLISSFALHEAIHIKLYRNKCENHAKGCVIVNLLSIKFIRPEYTCDFKSSLLVTLMGPLVPGLIGCLYFVLMTMSNVNQIWLVPFSFFFFSYVLHLLFLIPFWGDGKSLFTRLFYSGGKET
ncbi:hypothetical protein [Bacillus muralis]|uniref:hypothetical protein n=1 Tax=Peribacillus muralis TaxID=264697 RepID=UPI0007D7594E